MVPICLQDVNNDVQKHAIGKYIEFLSSFWSTRLPNSLNIFKKLFLKFLNKSFNFWRSFWKFVFIKFWSSEIFWIHLKRIFGFPQWNFQILKCFKFLRKSYFEKNILRLFNEKVKFSSFFKHFWAYAQLYVHVQVFLRATKLWRVCSFCCKCNFFGTHIVCWVLTFLYVCQFFHVRGLWSWLELGLHLG